MQRNQPRPLNDTEVVDFIEAARTRGRELTKKPNGTRNNSDFLKYLKKSGGLRLWGLRRDLKWAEREGLKFGLTAEEVRAIL